MLDYACNLFIFLNLIIERINWIFEVNEYQDRP